MQLHQSHPNPFNASTVIPFEVSQAGHVRLAIYDVIGRRVAVLRDRPSDPGYFTEVWDGRDASGRPAASGAYLVSLEVSGERQVQKVSLLK